MKIEFKKMNQLMALFVFISSLVVYTLTVAPTVSFWDCGEFISAGFTLGIPHPPGAPMYLLLSRVAAMFALDISHVAFMFNYLSVLLSSLAILLMYLSIVRLFNEWKGFPQTKYEFLIRSFSALIGSFAFAFSHSFWFNAVETELYAAHSFLTATMIWITLLWVEHHEEEGSDRYILLFAYMVGISTATHIVTLLNIPFLTIFYYIKKSKERSFMKLAFYALFGLMLSFVIYPGVSKYFPTLVLMLGNISWGAVIILLFISLSVYMYLTKQNRILTLLTASLTLVLIGYSSHSMIYIRSNLNPQIDENNPETLSKFIKYINREQYGSMDILPRRWNVKGRINKINWIGDGTGVLHRFPNGEVKKIKSVEELGYSPSKFEHLGAQLQFTWNYQIVHMFFRGIAWNFLGLPDGEPQDAPSDLSKFFMIPLLLFMFGFIYQFSRNYRTAGMMTVWLCITILLYPKGGFLQIALIFGGLYGLYYSFKDSFKEDVSLHGWALMAIFVMSGIALVIYLNPNEPQPRERDYIFVAAFYIVGIWISYGVYALINFLKDWVDNQNLTYAVFAIIFLLVPINMLAKNYHGHNRSGNMVAWDYSYNILMSCDKNAILFTNGDNDTFPVWYLQLVEGIRPDVTSINLSLVNTPWYIKQQKYGQLGKAAPFRKSDIQIEKQYKTPIPWKTRKMKIKVPKDQILASDYSDYQLFTGKSTQSIEKDTNLVFELPPQKMLQTGQGMRGFLRVQDLVVMNIILNNNWKRPINWAVTVGGGNLMGGLRDYMRMDGLVYKLTPWKGWQFDPKKLEDLILNKYKYRNLTDKDLFLNSNIQGLLQNIRSAFLQLAQYYSQKGNIAKQKELIVKMNEYISPDVIPIRNRSVHLLIDLMTKFDDLSKVKIEALANEYSETDLEFIWKNAHAMKNQSLRNLTMEAQMSKLDVTNQKRMQLAIYLIRFNTEDTTIQNLYKKRFMEEYRSNKTFLNRLENL